MKKILLLTSSIVFTNFTYAQVDLAATLGMNNTPPINTVTQPTRDVNELIPNYGKDTESSEPLQKIDFAPSTSQPIKPDIKPAPHLASNPNLVINSPNLEDINRGKYNPNGNLPIPTNNMMDIGGTSSSPQRLQTEPTNLTTIQTDISSWNRTSLEEHASFGEKRTEQRYLEFLNNPKK